MLKIKCNRCNKVLKTPGALAFSPPYEGSHTVKYHVCVKCWEDVMLFINDITVKLVVVNAS